MMYIFSKPILHSTPILPIPFFLLFVNTTAQNRTAAHALSLSPFHFSLFILRLCERVYMYSFFQENNNIKLGEPLNVLSIAQQSLHAQTPTALAWQDFNTLHTTGKRPQLQE